MHYQSPADVCAEYAKAHHCDKTDEFGTTSTLEAVTVVSETPDTARVEVRWHTSGHAPDAGYYEVVEPTVFVLVKRPDGWHILSTEDLPYE